MVREYSHGADIKHVLTNMEKPNMSKPVDLPKSRVTKTEKDIWKQDISTYVERKKNLRKTSEPFSPSSWDSASKGSRRSSVECQHSRPSRMERQHRSPMIHQRDRVQIPSTQELTQGDVDPKARYIEQLLERPHPCPVPQEISGKYRGDRPYPVRHLD